MTKINTYPEMNEAIKDLLGTSEEPFKQYVLQRIVELEQEAEQYKTALEAIAYRGFNVEPKRIVVKMQSIAREALVNKR